MDTQDMNQMSTQTYVQREHVMSVGEWILTIIIASIPIVNIICLIVWAVSSSEDKKSRKNWAIAQLIVVIVMSVISFLAAGAISAALMSMTGLAL